MKTLRVLACVLALAGSATPALSADLVFRKDQGPMILETFDGRPYWEMQAFCAGVHGASANWFSRRGDLTRSKTHEKDALGAFQDAVGQLRRDRGISEAAATRLVEPVVQMGGRRTAEALRVSGLDVKGQWNYWRSFCADAKVAYVRMAR